MKLQFINNNSCVLNAGDVRILFSYGKCVAYVDLATDEAFRSNDFWSKTTSKHINAFLGDYNFHKETISEVSEAHLNSLYVGFMPDEVIAGE